MATPDVRIMLSGGAANTDPNASLGGARSTTAVTQQSAASTLAAPFSIDYASGHLPAKIGAGTLTYIAASSAFTWQPNSAASAGPPVPIAASTTIAVPDVDDLGYLVVTQDGVTTPPVVDVATTVTIGHNSLATFGAVDAAQSALGFVRHRMVWLLNNSTATLSGWRGYIADGADGGVTLDFGYDPAGVDGTVAVIADESTVPAGVTFAAPSTDLATGTLMPDIAAGSALPIWLRLTLVGPGTEAQPNFSMPVFGAPS